MKTETHLKTLDILVEKIISQETALDYKDYEIRRLREKIEKIEVKLKEYE